MGTTWKRNGIIGGIGLALFLAGMLLGRRSRPERIVTRDVVRTQTVEVEKVRTVTVHDQVEAKAVEAKVRTVTVTKWRWLPGGVAEAEQVTRAATDTASRETSTEHAVATTDASKQLQTLTVTEHLVEVQAARPKWSVTLMPGVDLRGASSLPYHAVVGASVERRVIGPVSIGLWGNSALAGGISIRGDL